MYFSFCLKKNSLKFDFNNWSFQYSQRAYHNALFKLNQFSPCLRNHDYKRKAGCIYLGSYRNTNLKSLLENFFYIWAITYKYWRYWQKIVYVERSAGNHEFVTLAHITLFIFIVLNQSLKPGTVAQVLIVTLCIFQCTNSIVRYFILILYLTVIYRVSETIVFEIIL